jgi:hypothetical protein
MEEYRYFTRLERIPENSGAGPAGTTPLFSGFSWSFRDLLNIKRKKETAR